MKISVASLCILFFVWACSKKAETTSAEASSDEWPEMELFHSIIAEAFHPFKDSANLAPAKKLAEAMAVEAVKGETGPLPVEVNTEKVKGQLEKLKKDTRTLTDQIKGGDKDQNIGASL